jgi:D-alanyl-lipoteichoic acid acyltransferase DltB (MBOAT superfamily)
MLFNSFEFCIFFPVVLVLYWLVYKNRHAQNLILLAGSMFFYGMLHYSFPIYLMALIAVSYGMGRLIEKQQHEKKRMWLAILAVAVLCAGLFYTKYSDFVLGSIPDLQQWQRSALHILVPVGISFYTFAVIGYVLDIYYESIEAERSFLTYAAYISFFPHLLVGPIPSAATLLPQFKKKATVSLNSVTEGIGEFVWGLFKKMVVADNILMAVNYSFSANNEDLSGSSMLVGVAMFGLFVYADFSGYSSMARGCAKLLGIDLAHNFRTPLFSTSVSEYWRRWHISLISWFTAYIYTPIVFALKGWRRTGILIGVFVTFLISGIWHGAGAQYVVFGVLNGLAIVYEILTGDIRKRIFGRMPRAVASILSNIFLLTFIMFTWVFGKADSLSHAMSILSRICSGSLFTMPDSFLTGYLIWAVPMLVVEWIQRKGNYTMDIQQWFPVKVTRKGREQRNTKMLALQSISKIALYSLIVCAVYFFHKKMSLAEYYYFKF